MKGTDSYRISIELLEEIDNLAGTTDFQIDYRASSVTVTGFDLANMSHDPLASIEPLKAQSIGKGVIHLFRDFQDYNEKGTTPENLPGDDTMVSIIAVPTYFTATDILGFIGDHYMDFLTHIRILKSEKPNRFLVLLKFGDAVKAAEFQYYYDGKPFNSMEPEACHVVFVKSIVLNGNGAQEGSESLLPFIVQDPFTSSTSLNKLSQHDTNKTQIELPTCPVCLERLDHEISGLLTIPCQHTFHCQCLSRWRDDTCPVCRYTNNIPNNNIRQSVRRLSQINSRIQLQQTQQNPPGDIGQQQSVDHSGVETCMACPVSENLWVCLICGNLGCSRYAPGQHSLNHFIETGHCFAMELSSSRVWDYAGDNYVHRLIASESDGKIVEFPEKDEGHKSGTSKMESQQIESSELLLSQLISQREYYELLLKEKTGTERTKRTSSVAESLNNNRKISELETKLGEVTADLDKLKLNVVPALKQKISMKEVSLKLASQELSESNALNEGLSEKVEFLTAQNKELQAQVEDLGDQVKDLMFYLESQAKFKDQPDEVKEGQIIIKPSKAKKSKKKKN